MSKSGLSDILAAGFSSKKDRRSSKEERNAIERALPKSEPSVQFHQTRRGKNSFAMLVGLL